MWDGAIPSCSWNAAAGWKSHKAAARYKQQHGGTLVTGEESKDVMRNPLRNELNRNQIVAGIR